MNHQNAPVRIALLRGINVAGRNRVPMAALQAVLESHGLGDVRTHIQSGNVLFTGGGSDEEAVAAIEGAVAGAFGVSTTAVVRSPADLAAAAAASPFAAAGRDPSLVHVVFLRDVPEAAAVASLDPDRSPPDAFAVIGREVHVFYPNGSGRSKLTVDYFDRALGTVGTARNLNTIRTLIEMATSR